jgi:hypothetical protein
MPRLLKKNSKHCFHPGSAHVCFLWMRRISCAILHFAVWSRDRSQTHDSSPVITLSKKFGSISSLLSKSWQISNRFALCSIDVFRYKLFAGANGLLEFYELHFYPSLFLLQSSWHSISGLSPSQLALLPHFDHLLPRLVFQNEGRLQHFLSPLWKLCAT